MGRQFNYTILPAHTMGANFNSNFKDLSNIEAYSMFATWTGSPVGVLWLQSSVDGTNFINIAGSNTAVSGAGTFLWDVFGPGYDKVRLAYVFTSGSGSCSAIISGKGLPD